ncbi:MAG: response regulator transcription factor [Bacteroidia bacterium]
MKILLVEDELTLSQTIARYLKDDGYICEVAGDFAAAVQKIELYSYDCILLDLMIPGGHGFDVLSLLRKKNSQTGVIIISANDDTENCVKGLDMGADDYLSKPFHLPELQARVRSVLRRRKFDGHTNIQFREILINPTEKLAYVNEERLNLTKTEYELLLFFITNKHRVMAKISIAEHLWGDSMDLANNHDFLYSHIKNLRKKMTEKGGGDYIKSVYGMGYRWEE